MEIQRKAANRNRFKDWARLVNPTPIKLITINQEQNIELLFQNQSGKPANGQYHYKIMFTPDDLGKIIAEAMKQAITKPK